LSRRALVDTGGQGTHSGDLIGHLLPHQVTAETDLAALSDEELHAVGETQVVRIEAIAALDALIIPLRRIAPFIRDHAAFTRTRGGTRHRRTARKRHLCLIRQGTEAHARDVDWNVEHHRTLGARAKHGLGDALLAVTFDHETRQRSRKEGQIVEPRDFLEHREAAHAVTPEFSLDVDVVDHLGREDLAAPEQLLVATAVIERFGVVRCRRRCFG
jgi:hypothetical protein